MTTQKQLPICIPAARPLVPLEAIMVLLDIDEDSVLGLIDGGELRWAWNIASAGSDRREVRVLRESILSYCALSGQPSGEESLWTIVFGHSRDVVKSTELQRLFSCSSSHVHRLIKDKDLVALNAATTGPNGFARITRASVIAFLQARRIQ